MSVPPENMQGLAALSAETYGVPTSLLDWQIGQESSWNPNAVNSNCTNGICGTPALGIAQFQPDTAVQFGINPMDPNQAIPAMAQYDAQLYAKTGNWNTALQHYGTLAPGQSVPGNVATAPMQGNVPWYEVLWQTAVDTYKLSNPVTGLDAAYKTAVPSSLTDIWARMGMGMIGLIFVGSAFLLWRGESAVKIIDAPDSAPWHKPAIEAALAA